MGGLCAVTLGAAPAKYAERVDITPSSVLREYFELVLSGNYESASYMWDEPSRERALRFGIEYPGITMRVDALSPVVRNIDRMRDYIMPGVRGSRKMEDGFVQVEFSTVVEGEVVECAYWLRRHGTWYWFVYPQDYYARNWPVRESKYLRVHVHPDVERFLGKAVLDEADRFVERLADSLDLSRDVRALLKERKIEFFYCDSDSTVRAITRVHTKGMLDLVSNDIISADFPHYHELAHLLVALKLRTLPLYTLPLLREGLAVHYGGRWGKSQSALRDLGIYLYKEDLVELDSILTARSFDSTTGADIAYPLAGVFTEYLLDRLGEEGYFRLYAELSGTPEEMRAMSPDTVRARLAAAVGVPDWAALLADFDRFLDTDMEPRRSALAGGVDDGSTVLSADGVRVVRNRRWVGFEFTPDHNPPSGTLLFGRDPRLKDDVSLLFLEQFGTEEPFEGYRYGVRFDQFEAGLYDYAANQLLAKYILGISPPGDYHDSTANRVSIRFRRELTDGVLPLPGDYRMLDR